MMALSARWHARCEHSGRSDGDRRRTPFSLNRWDMQQDASWEDVALTCETHPPPTRDESSVCLCCAWGCAQIRRAGESCSGAAGCLIMQQSHCWAMPLRFNWGQFPQQSQETPHSLDNLLGHCWETWRGRSEHQEVEETCFMKQKTKKKTEVGRQARRPRPLSWWDLPVSTHCYSFSSLLPTFAVGFSFTGVCVQRRAVSTPVLSYSKWSRPCRFSINHQRVDVCALPAAQNDPFCNGSKWKRSPLSLAIPWFSTKKEKGSEDRDR